MLYAESASVMVMVNCTLPFMQLTEAGLPPSCAGGGALSWLTAELRRRRCAADTNVDDDRNDDDDGHGY